MGEILRYPWMELDNRLWRFMSIPIWLFYLLFYLITAVQLMQLLYHRHKFPSYHSTVLAIGYVFAGLRLVYFGKGIFIPVNESWVNFFDEILCWFPLNLQYFMISLLFVFNLKIIQGRDWRYTGFRFLIAWGVSNAIYLILSVAWFAVVGTTIYGDASIVWTRFLMVIIPDMTVIACIALFWVVGRKKGNLKSNQKNWWTRSMVLNLTIAICLLFRVILYILLGTYLLTPVLLQVNFTKTMFDVLRMVMFVFSEIIPVLATLIYLKQIPTTRAHPVIPKETHSTLPRPINSVPAHYRFPEDQGYSSSFFDGSPYSRSPFKYGTLEDKDGGGNASSYYSKSFHSGHGFQSRKSDSYLYRGETEGEEDQPIQYAQGDQDANIYGAHPHSDTPTLVARSPPVQLSNMS